MSSMNAITSKEKVKLQDIDASPNNGLTREQAEARTAELGAQLNELNELMYASNAKGLLVVLQGMDTSGKDGTIRCLLNYANAQSTHVVPFKVPTALEFSP